MADPIQPASETPAIETPAPPAFTPHTDTPTSLSVAPEAEVVAPDPVVDAPADPSAPKAPVEAATPDPAKPEEPAKPVDAEAKPDAPAESAITAPEPIVYPEWKLPEGITPDTERLAAFTEALAGVRVPPEVGQKLLDMHTSTLQQQADYLVAEQHRVFGEMRADWRKQMLADPEIGGNGHQTAMGAIARVRDAVISNAKPGTEQYKSDVQAFNDAMVITGAGDNPVILKMFHRMARYLDEPQSPSLPNTNLGAVPNGGMPKQGLKGIYKANREAREAGNG